jgi:hypothetical protein
MNTQTIIEAVFMYVVIISSVLYWMTLVADLIDDHNKQARARKNKQHNNKSATLTYGDESSAEVERMYREAGLIK